MARMVTWYDYAGAAAFLKAGRDKRQRKVGANGVVALKPGGAIGLTLHYTEIVCWEVDGTVTIKSGGWNTRTTWRWINEFTRCRVQGLSDPILGAAGVQSHTPARVSKCRRCTGGSNTIKPECSGKPGYWDDAAWCEGGKSHVWPMGADGRTDWDAEPHAEPCLHGKTERHALAPCQHGKTAHHVLPEYAQQCHQCQGTGRYDYGSKPVYLPWDGSPLAIVPATGLPAPAGWAEPVTVYVPAVKGKGKGKGKPAPADTYIPYAPAVPAPEHSYTDSGDLLGAVLPGLEEHVDYPCGCRDSDGVLVGRVSAVIIHLNDDTHRWDRLRIADWLDTLDSAGLTFPVPA